MATDTKTDNLVINKLTKAQYDEAWAAGTLSDTELYIITDENLSLPAYPTADGDYYLTSGVADGVVSTEWETKPTTLAGYGITDAKIESGTITLGSQSVTPLYSSNLAGKGSATIPVYFDANGAPTAITSYSGTSAGAMLLKGTDTRSVNGNPSTYIVTGQCANVQSEFKSRSTLGLSGSYAQLLTFKPWSDSSGGYPKQLLISDSASEGLQFRYGTGASSWSSWLTVVTEESAQTITGKKTFTGDVVADTLSVGTLSSGIIVPQEATTDTPFQAVLPQIYAQGSSKALSLQSPTKTVRVGNYGGQMTTFDFSGTTNRTIKIPDADGTIALTSDLGNIQTITVDSALSDSSTNPVQNKIIKAALDGKQAAGSYAAASHTHTKSQITDFPTIPTKTSQLTNDSGFTTNAGTVTSVAVKMNGSTKGTVTSSGTIDLGTVLTSHQSLCISTTYANLKSLRDGGTLTPGATYRITDYEFTTTQAGSSSAGHGFDILVIADDSKTLNENARAVARSGDTYYSDSGDFPSDLSAWELKYCIDNDLSRFSWADATNGKGVIYYLKDDRGNIAPYDHKNCLFIRYKVTNSVTALSSLSGQYLGTTAGVSTGLTKGTDTKTYLTFDKYCYDNRIEPYRTSVTVDGTAYADTAKLNDITICAYSQDRTNTTKHLYGNTFEANCYDITFAPNYSSPYCYSNSFGNDCYSNSFGSNCCYNSLGNTCSYNSFGNTCYYNSFGNYCPANIFGNMCRGNSFGNYCRYNSFGNSCYYNSLGNYCDNNTFDTGCFYNSLGNTCSNNTFGEGCFYNSFATECSDNVIGGSCYHNSFGIGSGSNRLGDSCFYNSFGNGCLCNYLCSSGISSTYLNYAQYNAFDNGVSYVSLYDSDTTGSSSACLQNVHIHEGVKGTSSSRKVISVDRNLAYGTDVYAEGHVTMTV